jgi:hypothetical protein
MVERVEVCRQQEEARRIREETVTVDNVDDDDSTPQEDHEDDEGVETEREIWQVTDVTEEDFENPRNRRILCRSHFLYEVPNVFLTTLVHNLSPTTTGHNDHRFFSCFPLIC